MQQKAASGGISAPSAGQEWRTNWLLVLSGMIGISIGTIPSATLGLFMEPLNQEFGWSRTQISAGLTVFAIVSLPLTPFAGMLVDRFGPRRVAVPGVAISAAVFAMFAFLTGSTLQWLFIWFLYTLASLLTRSLVWNSAISGAFSTSRGLAIAVLLCGTAMAMSLSPIVARWLIDSFGWRIGYLGLGFGWGGVAFFLSLLFFRDRRHMKQPSSSASAPVEMSRPGGLTLKEALRSLTMNRIALAIFIQSIMGVSIMVHLVPLLMDRGITSVEAVGIAALLGFASIAGKLLTGFLVDRMAGSLLPVTVFSMPGLAYLIFLTADTSIPVLSVAVIFLGYASGASLQMATYLTTRYAGLRSFGTIFGVISSLMALSAGIGPILAGAVYDITGHYTYLLMTGVPAAVVAGLCVLGLGPYPEFSPVEPETAARPARAAA
ncbi:MAG: MFS transporter [Novosphingobium sp.]|nr:MFS transporter [Novosphingobium sp.]MCP5402892.1 MFS transporter [Novosphingobium sp.]